MNLFEFLLEILGYPINSAIRELNKVQNLSIGEFKYFQKNKRWNIYNYHCEKNPFYSNFIKNKSIKKWEDIPILKKRDINIPLSNLISNDYKKRDLRISSTSGSTGVPLIFVKDKFSHAITWALIKNRYSWFNIGLMTNQARFYGIPLDSCGYYKERIKDFLMNRYRFVVFDLSDEILKNYLNLFKKRKFEVIYGYTNSMVIFAKYLIKKNVILKHVCSSLRVCIATSEQCEDSDINVLEKGFGIRVIKEYGASEVDLIAFVNKDNEWVISNEVVYMEVVDENDKPVNDGTAGRILLTSLYNKAMPIIRYEICDLGCILRRPNKHHDLLVSLKGRLNDLAILPGGRKVPGFTLYYVSRHILEASGVVKEYFIEQTSVKSFVFYVVLRAKLLDSDVKLIKKTMCEYLKSNVEISLKEVDKIKKSKSGKFKHFVSSVNPTN